VFVPDLLDHGARRAPDRACVVQSPYASLTFAEVDDRASRVARSLLDAGLRQGDRVVLIAANEPEFLELQAGCQRAAVTFVPLNYRLAPQELRLIVADCAPRLMIHGRGRAELGGEIDAPAVWHLGEEGLGQCYETVVASSAPLSRQPLEAAALAQIAYTSGTTGRPKGVAITNGALFGRVATLRADIAMHENDVFLQTLPLFHIANTLSFAFTTAAATCVTIAAFDADKALATCKQWGVSHTLVVPTIIAALRDALPRHADALSAMRLVMYGAAPITPDLLADAHASFGCGFAQLYGMTESGIGVMLSPRDHDRLRAGDVPATGRDLGFYQTAVHRADGTLAEPGEPGEVVISGPGLFDFYWANPTATSQTLRDGWVHTGDAGYHDSDGYLYVTDRIKDMIITGGENVYCSEVEAVLLAHGGVTDAAVIGIPDPKWGQTVHALIVATGPLPTSELDEHCRRRLGSYKCPKSYEIVSELPRNAAGKVLKHQLRDERKVTLRK
jgi:acyl-CoA synthetase (AMP-forming)/AMP-acid ligase II